MKKTGLIAKICTGGFFVVRYQGDDCAAFSSSYFVNLSEGNQVLAHLDKVGSMVMLDQKRNAAFEVFAHTQHQFQEVGGRGQTQLPLPRKRQACRITVGAFS